MLGFYWFGIHAKIQVNCKKFSAYDPPKTLPHQF